MCSEVAVGEVWMAWPPSAVLEGGARREALGGMESELVPTEPIQTSPTATVVIYKEKRR